MLLFTALAPWLQNESGADLYRFPSSDTAAICTSGDGLGNLTNYGFRTMAADDDSGLYIGTANPANIAQDAYGNAVGGWKLIRVEKQ